MANDRGRAFWERLVREVEAGGSQVAIARRHAVSSSWLGKWRRRLRDERAAGGALLPVRIVDTRPKARFELTVGTARLAFEEGADPEYIAALVRGLGS